MKHTPGPWKVTDNNYTLGVETEDGKYSVCDVCLSNGETRNDAEEDKANARLIASAPELLEALKWAMIFVRDLRYEEQKEKKAKIQALIQKAES